MDDIITRASALRIATANLMEDMVQTGKRLGMPPPLSDLDAARQRMETNRYRVLIMGEAKKGKSTFLNALMGDELLPVDVNIATAQVFHIGRAEQPAYRLRFEDESAEEITREQVRELGRQPLEEPEALPPGEDPLSVKFTLDQLRKKRAVRWIEVEGDFPFIQEEIEILDTPGLGSLFAEHARITQRFVPIADAVVFVLSSGGVITDFEMECVEEILQYTRQIFFIQTQIDNYTPDDWQARLRANTEHLNRRFVGKIGAPREPIRVWPLSSKLLLDATRETDPTRRVALLTASRFQESERAFRRFLFQVTGCVRIATALQQAEQYALQGREYMTSRVELLQKVTTEERSKMQQERTKRLQEFAREYGPTGIRRSKLIQDVRDIIAVAKDRFQRGLARNGRLYRHYDARIAKITSVKEAEELGQDISEGVVHFAGKHWLRCTSACTAQMLTRLSAEFSDAATWDIAAFRDTPTLRQAIRLERDPMSIKATFGDRVKMAWGSSSMILTVGAAVATVAGKVAVGAAAAALGPVAAGAALVFSVHQFRVAGQRIVENARPQLINYLGYVMDVVNAAYNEPDEQGFGLVTGYYTGLERAILDRITLLYEERKGMMESELEEMARLIEAGADETRSRIRQLQEHQVEWKAFDTRIREFTIELSNLQRAPLPNPSGLPAPQANLPRRIQQAPEEQPVESFLTGGKATSSSTPSTQHSLPPNPDSVTDPATAEIEVREWAREMIARNAGVKPSQDEVNGYFGFSRRRKVADDRTQTIYKEELAAFRATQPPKPAPPVEPDTTDTPAEDPIVRGYRKLVRAAYADGTFTRDEGTELDEYAHKHNMPAELVLKIEREVRAEWARRQTP